MERRAAQGPCSHFALFPTGGRDQVLILVVSQRTCASVHTRIILFRVVVVVVVVVVVCVCVCVCMCVFVCVCVCV